MFLNKQKIKGMIQSIVTKQSNSVRKSVSKTAQKFDNRVAPLEKKIEAMERYHKIEYVTESESEYKKIRTRK